MLLTIIIPAHNVAKHIINTLNSISSQEMIAEGFEVIVIDDASTDNTNSIIEQFIKENKHLNIQLVRLSENRGVSAARNIGIEKALGKYIMFLDGDDYLDDQYIKTIKEETMNKSADITFYGFNRVSEKNNILSNSFETNNLPTKKTSGEEMLSKVIQKKVEFRIDSSIYKKSFINKTKLRFTEGCHSGEDTEFIYKALILASEIEFINRIMTNYVIRVGSITNSYNIKRFQTIYARERIKDFVNNKGTSFTKKLINSTIDEQIIRLYLHNFNDCLNYLLDHKTGYKNAVLKLNHDIDKEYIDLRRKIVELIKKSPNLEKKLEIKAKIFIKSPILFNWILKKIDMSRTLLR